MMREPFTGSGWSLPVDGSNLPLPRVQVPERTCDGGDADIFLSGFGPIDKRLFYSWVLECLHFRRVF